MHALKWGRGGGDSIRVVRVGAQARLPATAQEGGTCRASCPLTPPLRVAFSNPCCRSYWDQGPENRAKVGIKDNLIRFSTGIESLEDIWADFEQAFAKI